jgi:dolichol-phosphate mannosyltransferase
MPRADFFVSVVAPLQDDEDIVEAFVDEILEILKREYENYELVLVDDGSRDRTDQKVSALLRKHVCVRLIRLSRRFGQEAAICAGLDSVIGDFIVVTVPDRDPPALIPEMVEKCRRGVGVVFGIRRHSNEEPFHLRVGRSLFYWYLNRVMRIDLPRNSTDFRVFSRQALNALIRIKDRYRYLRAFSMYVGYGNEGFTYDLAHRRAMPRVKSFSQAVGTAIGMIVANSTHPLRAVSLMGLILSLFSMFYMAYVVLVRVFADSVMPGWATRSLHTSAMFLFVFVILSVLCEYVGRLLEEVKERPLYYVLEERSSSVMIAEEERKNVVVESKED